MTQTFSQFITENVQSQREIETFAVALIEKWANESIKEMKKLRMPEIRFTDNNGHITYRSRYDDGSEITGTAVWNHSPEDWIGSIHFNDIPTAGRRWSRSFQNWVKKSNTTVRAVDEHKDGWGGAYGSSYRGEGAHSVFLYFDDKDLHEFATSTKDKGRVDEIFLRKMMTSRLDVLVHELQHAYDDYRSGGKYTDKQKDKDVSTGDIRRNDDEQYEKYLKYSHEVSARYTQVMSVLKKALMTGELKNFSYEYYGKNDLERFMKFFKENFGGWDILDADVKKRLLNRAAVEYQAWDTPRVKKKDLTENVTKLQNKLRRKYPDATIELRYDKFTHAINIDRLKHNDSDALQSILSDITKLADTYKAAAYSSPEKGFDGGGSIVEYRSLLKRLGFIRNYIKNKGKRDHRFNAAWIRYSKRDK